jgi:hypothetical protein
MQRRRCEASAARHTAVYRARMKALESPHVTVKVQGSGGGGASKYGQSVTERGWAETTQDMVERGR